MLFNFKCDLLIDQNRYIGKTCVGYKCFNNAEYEDKNGYLICLSCKNLLISTPSVITYPNYLCCGKIFQRELISRIINKL